MKFKISRSDFFKTLSHLQGIVDKKNSLPILANILIEAKDNQLILSSTDMDISIIEKDLISIFEKNRIIKIEAKGKKFDPNLHQAMTEIEDEKSDEGTVVQVIQSGYMMGERLLRPALVGVAKRKNSKNAEKEEKKEEK